MNSCLLDPTCYYTKSTIHSTVLQYYSTSIPRIAIRNDREIAQFASAGVSILVRACSAPAAVALLFGARARRTYSYTCTVALVLRAHRMWVCPKFWTRCRRELTHSILLVVHPDFHQVCPVFDVPLGPKLRQINDTDRNTLASVCQIQLVRTVVLFIDLVVLDLPRTGSTATSRVSPCTHCTIHI